MARRERTTALPRQRPRGKRGDNAPRFAGISWTEARLRSLIIGVAGVMLVAVIAAFAYRLYDQQVLRPQQVVLQVDGEKVRLNYYADRLLPWVQENSSSGISTSVLEDQLLGKLEEESLTLLVAQDRGITVSEDDINQGIAQTLGVTGASGSSFDTLYRQKRDELKMSDANYRRMVKASVAHDRVMAQLREGLGAEGEQFELRTVVVESKEKGDDVLKRIQGGADIGSIAQTESNDLQTRQQDGIMPPEPLSLLPDNVQAAVQGKGQGDVIGPIEVAGNWWVFRIERKTNIAYTDAQKDQLAQQQLDKLIAEKRQQVKIQRSLDASDVRWAEGQAN